MVYRFFLGDSLSLGGGRKKKTTVFILLTLTALGPSLLTSVEGPLTERITIIIMTVPRKKRYLNEAKRVNQDIYDDFKLKKKHLVPMLNTKKYFSASRVKHPWQ